MFKVKVHILSCTSKYTSNAYYEVSLSLSKSSAITWVSLYSATLQPNLIMFYLPRVEDAEWIFTHIKSTMPMSVHHDEGLYKVVTGVKFSSYSSFGLTNDLNKSTGF